MSNLVITIISIAIGAIVAIMAIYYGGSAYGTYQANAAANSIVNGMKQMAASGALYRANYGFTTICTNNPAYPAFNNNFCAWNYTFIAGWGLTNAFVHGADYGNYFWPYDFFPGTPGGSGLTVHNALIGPLIYNGTTYYLIGGYGNDSQGDTVGFMITDGSSSGGSVQPTDGIVAICQAINKSQGTLPIWSGTTWNATYGLPQNTATGYYGIPGYGGSNFNNIAVPQGVCYLDTVWNGTGLSINYYLRF